MNEIKDIKKKELYEVKLEAHLKNIIRVPGWLSG